MGDTARDIADGIMDEHAPEPKFSSSPEITAVMREAFRDAIASALTAYGDARLAAEHRRGVELAEHLDKVIALAAAEVKRANEAEAAREALEAALREAEATIGLVLKRVGELNRDDEAGIRTVLANIRDGLRALLSPSGNGEVT